MRIPYITNKQMKELEKRKKIRDLEDRLIRLVTTTINIPINERAIYIEQIGKLSMEYHELSGEFFTMRPRYRDKE